MLLYGAAVPWYAPLLPLILWRRPDTHAHDGCAGRLPCSCRVAVAVCESLQGRVLLVDCWCISRHHCSVAVALAAITA